MKCAHPCKILAHTPAWELAPIYTFTQRNYNICKISLSAGGIFYGFISTEIFYNFLNKKIFKFLCDNTIGCLCLCHLN